ncbi:alpha-taxilin [Quillaja saponaria]|uniref:Alpha-taxilin n=1 Tax=Quillaja saponaria TaxID=32244 RepID=A0AAD7Q555_QUISA|nr:alpha-taxilin [Quillaja saponaria]
MQGPNTNQLPEVDSLPDGFVDSSADTLAPLPPTFEQEKPLNDYKEEGSSKLGSSNEVVDNSAVDNPQTNQDIEHTEGARITPDLAVSDDSVRVPRSSEKKEQHQVKCQSSDRSTYECLEASAIAVKGSSPQENADALKNRKPETTETKRKSVKRTFKSEKEFLEFTLKYQQVLAERDAALSVRDKLESLCRELQRQNKMLMDECKRVSMEGQNLRLDLSARFQDAIKDVSHKLEEQKDESISQLKENEMLRNKLKQLADQYALSEQHNAQMLKQKTLELQIADLKIKQHDEKSVQEQTQMKLYAEQVSQLLATEKNLRLQLTADGEKFQQFQDALLKSNEVFETFKQEIEKMAKSVKELKKENQFLKSKCDKSDVTLIELVDERERLKKQLKKIKNQKEKLESLCRLLQAERKRGTGSNCSDSVPM